MSIVSNDAAAAPSIKMNTMMMRCGEELCQQSLKIRRGCPMPCCTPLYAQNEIELSPDCSDLRSSPTVLHSIRPFRMISISRTLSPERSSRRRRG